MLFLYAVTTVAPEPSSFVDAVAAVGVVATAILAIGAVLVKGYRLVDRGADTVVDKLREELRVGEMAEQIAAIHSEVTLNGGTSLKDIVRRNTEINAGIAERQAEMSGEVANLGERLAALSLRMQNVEQQLERVVTEELAQLDLMLKHKLDQHPGET